MPPHVVRAARVSLLISVAVAAAASQAIGQPNGAARSARVIGVVRAESGRPIFSAQISVVSPARGGTTDSLGRFELAGLPRGRLRLRVMAFGYQPADTTIALEDGQTVEWRIVLPPAPVLGPTAEQYAAASAAAAAVGRIDSVALGRISLDTTHAFDFATFGVRLLSASVRGRPDSNRVLSPLSAGQALALAMAASKDSTTILMARGLAVGDMDQATLAKRTQWFNRSLQGRKDVMVSMANALWGELYAGSRQRRHAERVSRGG